MAWGILKEIGKSGQVSPILREARLSQDCQNRTVGTPYQRLQAQKISSESVEFFSYMLWFLTVNRPEMAKLATVFLIPQKFRHSQASEIFTVSALGTHL